jgi:hypothetical protein
MENWKQAQIIKEKEKFYCRVFCHITQNDKNPAQMSLSGTFNLYLSGPVLFRMRGVQNKRHSERSCTQHKCFIHLWKSNSGGSDVWTLSLKLSLVRVCVCVYKLTDWYTGRLLLAWCYSWISIMQLLRIGSLDTNSKLQPEMSMH